MSTPDAPPGESERPAGAESRPETRCFSTPAAERDKEKNGRLEKAQEAAREIIRNENDLINHRLTAFLTLQGFLFAAVVFGSQGFAAKDREYQHVAAFFLIVVSYAGFVVPRLLEPVVRAANRHINATREWWYEYRSDVEYRDVCPFPGLVGNTARSREAFLLFWMVWTEDDGEDVSTDVNYIVQLNDAAVGRRPKPKRSERNNYVVQLGFDDNKKFNDERREELRKRIDDVRQGAPRLIRLLEGLWGILLGLFVLVFLSLLPWFLWVVFAVFFLLFVSYLVGNTPPQIQTPSPPADPRQAEVN